jgi:catechol 2,3-dioxygenase-like lactoylglutathione lyase family enzyme
MQWNHAGIKTSDVNRSLHFYCDILGFRKLEEVVILNKNYVFVGNDTIKIEIEEKKPGDTQSNMKEQSGLYHLCFTVDDIEKTASELKNKDVKFMLPVSQFIPGRKIAFIEDPDGVIIQLIQYIPE